MFLFSYLKPKKGCSFYFFAQFNTKRDVIFRGSVKDVLKGLKK